MRKVNFILTTAIVLLTGCTSQNVVKLNDTVVKANDDLRIAADLFNKKFEAVADYNYTIIEKERQVLVALIDKKVKEVAALKAEMPGGEDFKNAFVDYYKFERDIYDTDFKNICLIAGKDEIGKLSEIALQMKEKTGREDAMEKKIHAEQENYARKNNLKLNH